MNDKIKKALANVVAKLESQKDQRLADIRTAYNAMNPQRRAKFREWVQEVGGVESKFYGSQFLAQTQIGVLVLEGDGDARGISVAPASLVRAIAAWDKNEEYIPNLCKD